MTSTLSSALEPEAELPAQPSAAARPRTGLRSLDALLIFAVVGLVCLVSLPRLQDYVQRTNEADAATAIEVLGAAWIEAGEEPSGTAITPHLAALVGLNDSLRHRLRDARAVDASDVLLYHGYYFRVVATGDPTTHLVAWPRRSGRTGTRSFRWSSDGALAEHANSDGRWSGLERKPEDLDHEQWQVVERPGG